MYWPHPIDLGKIAQHEDPNLMGDDNIHESQGLECTHLREKAIILSTTYMCLTCL